MPEDYVPTPEDIQRLIQQTGGLNLAGQGGGGILGRLRNQAKQKTDPTYSSGFDYARSIAGGMPFEDVVAPGMSFSPEDPMGYTQADLDLRNRYVGEGPAPVMPVAPTKGTPFAPNEGFVQMPSAPQGVAQPTRFMPFLQDLDFSGLPRYEDIRDIRGVEDIRPSLFDFDVQEILKDVDTLKNIDTERFEDLDLSGIDIPSIAPVFPTAPVRQEPTTPIVQEPITPVMPQVPVMPRVPVMLEPVIQQPIAPIFQEPQIPVLPKPVIQQIPEPVIQQPPVRQEVSFVPEIPSIPMNFTGLPQMPVIPNIPVIPELPIVPQPIVPQPIVPQTIQPMNFTRLSNLPVSNFVQPSVEDIVSPISRGRTLPQTPRGLFSL